MMTADGRAQVLHDAIRAANPNCAKLTASEDAALLASLKALWGAADLGYITSSAQINPGTLHSQKGQPVSTTGGPAAQTGQVVSDMPVAGLGTIS